MTTEALTPPSTPAQWSLAQIIEALSRPLPTGLTEKLKDKGNADYLPWYRANKILDKYAPGWEWEVQSTNFTEDRIFITGCLIIPTKHGLVKRCATGTEELKRTVWDKKANQYVAKEIAYGDPSSNAESMAFRRCAARFGLALYLYDKSTRDDYAKNYQQAQPTTKVEPSNNKKCSDSEIKRLFAIANERGIPEQRIKEIASRYGYKSRKDILAKDYQAILSELEKLPQELANKAQRKKMFDLARTNRLLDSDIKTILDQFGYNSSAQIPVSRVESVLETIRITFPWQLWQSEIHAQSWAVAYLQTKKIDYLLDDCANAYTEVVCNPGENKYQAWYRFILENFG